MKIVIDIGNSSIKAMAGAELFNCAYSADWVTALMEFINAKIQGDSLVVYSSVNDSALDVLKNSIAAINNITLQDSNEILKLQNYIDFTQVSGMGNDRMLGLIGAISKKDAPLITIDCGTATTINCVDANKICIGGAILPGVFTQYKSLHENTRALKNIDVIESNRFAGSDTSRAIASGILRGSAGAVIHIVKGIIDESGLVNCNIFLTGGAAGLISNWLRTEFPDIIEVPYLNLDGINILSGLL